MTADAVERAVSIEEIEIAVANLPIPLTGSPHPNERLRRTLAAKAALKSREATPAPLAAVIGDIARADWQIARARAG